jgi:lipid A 3-O-deacylase
VFGLAEAGVVLLGAAAFLGGAFAASGQKNTDPSFLTAGGGYFHIEGGEGAAAELGLSCRGARPLWAFRPFGGIMTTSAGAFYAYGGVAYDYLLGEGLALTPSFAPGLYARGGGIDLGHVVEFRSQVELSRRFKDRSRLGLSLSHISNGGLGKANPGSNTLALNYTLPLRRLFGHPPGIQ